MPAWEDVDPAAAARTARRLYRLTPAAWPRPASAASPLAPLWAAAPPSPPPRLGAALRPAEAEFDRQRTRLRGLTGLRLRGLTGLRLRAGQNVYGVS